MGQVPEKFEGGATFAARPLNLSVVGAIGNLSTAQDVHVMHNVLPCN